MSGWERKAPLKDHIDHLWDGWDRCHCPECTGSLIPRGCHVVRRGTYSMLCVVNGPFDLMLDSHFQGAMPRLYKIRPAEKPVSVKESGLSSPICLLNI